MLLFYCTLSALLTIVGVVLPLARRELKHQRDEFTKQHRAFMLITVKRYYPELGSLSYEEIERNYNVTEAYNRIHWSSQ